MKKVINPGFAKKTINLIDNIVYSHQKDLNGNPMELKMSIMLQNGNSEMRLAAGEDDPKEDHSPKPALLWIPGGGWRGADKNLMLGEMSEFARAGYVVASMYYRSSAEGHWPDQLIDVKTAIRFLRANAEKYEINPDKIAVFNNGFVEQVGTPQEIYNHSKTEFVCDFIGDINKLGKSVVSQLNREGASLDGEKHAYIRLELIHFNPEPGCLKLTGEVMDFDYNGLTTKYRVNTCGEVIRVIKVNDGRPIYQTGEQIDMYLNPADIMQY